MKGKSLWAPAVVSATIWGCAHPTYDRLLPEDDIPGLRDGKAVTVSAGKKTVFVPVSWRNHQVDLAVHEMGSGKRSRVLVLVHGVLSDHETWRFVAGELAENYDLLLIDLPGSGASDHPAPARAPGDLFTPHALADVTLQAVGSRLEARAGPAPQIALIGHSLGGSAILKMFDDEVRSRHAGVMNRIDRVILFAPMDLAHPAPDPPMEKLIQARGWQIGLANSMGFLKEMGAKAMEESMHDPSKAPREEVDRGVMMLTDRGLRTGSQAQLSQSFLWREIGESVDDRRRVYSAVDVAPLIIWGREDGSLPVTTGEEMASRIPGAELMIFENGKHSVHMEYPARAVDLIDRHLRR